MARLSATEIEQIEDAKKIVETLRSRLLLLERAPSPKPLGDIGWLRTRCDDTLRPGVNEHWRCLSLAQLKKDVTNFNTEFPGLLAPDLLEAVENAPEFYNPRPPR